MITRYLALIAILLTCVTGCAQNTKSPEPKAKGSLTAVFYNVENLYDTYNDPATDDQEFTPTGRIPWTEERLKLKISRLAEVVRHIDKPGSPALVGLAEVENKQVLEMLVNSAELQYIGYKIVHYDSPDERGIDVALLYNPQAFTMVASEPLQVELPMGDRTRDILYVKGKLANGQVLHVFVNHWPSRREGTDVSEPKRMIAASVVKSKINEIRKTEKAPNILIMGDFNDEPSDNSIAKGLGAAIPEPKASSKVLYSLLYNEYKNGQGSLYYKDWDLFDQIIVSGNLLSQNKGLRTSASDAGIYKADFLLFKSKNGPERPNRTMSDKYHGGYSDHLPVYVKFKTL